MCIIYLLVPPPPAIVGEGVEVAAVRQDVVGVDALRLALQRRLLLMLPLLVGEVLGVLVGGAAPASVEARCVNICQGKPGRRLAKSQKLRLYVTFLSHEILTSICPCCL